MKERPRLGKKEPGNDDYLSLRHINKSGSPYSFQPTHSTSTNRMTAISSFTPAYDANGNLLSDGNHTYSWNADGRPTTIDGVNLTCDALGRMVEQNRSGAYTQIVYSPTGQKFALMNGQTLQKVINSTAYTVDYAYNLAGELTSITYPSGRIVQQNVDTIGRLSSIVGTLNSVNTTYASGFAYNSAFQTTGLQYGNGIFASFGFSADRLLLNCLDYSTTSRGGSCAHDATTKFGLNYSYPAAGSNNGQIAGITDSVDNGRSATYGYDALYRLTSAVTTGSASYPQWGLSWNYDRYGNRTAQTVTAGSGVPSNSVQVDATTNRITTAGYVYDANGNMTNDGNSTLVYDAENRTVSASNGGASGAYIFDGNSLRVKKVSGTTTTVYIFSGTKVIAEYDNGAAPGSPTREYIYSGSALLAKIDSSGTKYYHQDHLSNRLLTDSAGNTTAQLAHFPFGESWYNSTNDKLLFTSYERDSESSNDYAMMRSYVNRLARFSSPDPLGLAAASLDSPQTFDKYSYVNNIPLSYFDPLGMGPCKHGSDDCEREHKFNDAIGSCYATGFYVNGSPAGCSFLNYIVQQGLAQVCLTSNCAVRADLQPTPGGATIVLNLGSGYAVPLFLCAGKDGCGPTGHWIEVYTLTLGWIALPGLNGSGTTGGGSSKNGNGSNGTITDEQKLMALAAAGRMATNYLTCLGKGAANGAAWGGSLGVGLRWAGSRFFPSMGGNIPFTPGLTIWGAWGGYAVGGLRAAVTCDF